MTSVEKRESLLYCNGHTSEEGNALITCFRCGVCCMGPRIHLTLVEARRISDSLGISWQEFEDMYIDPIYLGGDRFLLRQSHGACVFLKQEAGSYENRCLIHDFRPFSCLSWTPSLYRRQCQAGLVKYWGLEVSPLAQLLGSDEIILDFYSLCLSILEESVSI